MSQNTKSDATGLGLSKKLLFVVLAIAVTFVAFYFGRPGVVEASKKDGEKFGDWVVSCSSPAVKEDASDKEKAAAQDATICVLSHTVVVSEEGKEDRPIALFQFGYYGANKELAMVQVLPLGISIQAGTSIISGDKMIAKGSYTTCLSGGCNAIAPISEEDLKTIIQSDKNAVAILNATGSQINIPFSSKELEKGLKFLQQ